MLCYPVIAFDQPFTHKGSQKNLLGEERPGRAGRRACRTRSKSPTRRRPASSGTRTKTKACRPKTASSSTQALLAHKVPAELHIYEKGRHGVGLAKDMPGTDGWPAACIAWLKNRGMTSP